MARERKDLRFCAHIPDASTRVSATGNEDVECGMKINTKDARQMPVVMTNDLVCFEIPTLDHLVFSGREEIGMSRRDGDATDSVDVTCEREFEGARSEIPDLIVSQKDAP